MDRELAADALAVSDEPGGRPGDDDAHLIAGLRRGDEAAFTELVDRHGPGLLRLARSYVRDSDAALDVVQETWLGVLGSIGRFEGRSSLKTWLYRILVKRAATRARRDSRVRPFSELARQEADAQEQAVDPDWFLAAGPDRGGWVSIPRRWNLDPGDEVQMRAILATVREAIEALPVAQRTVISLRDIDGWSAEEVCNALAISATNQRVLLHRARTKVRRAAQAQLEGEGA